MTLWLSSAPNIISLLVAIKRLQAFARVFGVPYEERKFVKAMGFYWNASRKCWKKVVSEEGLPLDTHEKLLHHFGDSIHIRVE